MLQEEIKLRVQAEERYKQLELLVHPDVQHHAMPDLLSHTSSTRRGSVRRSSSFSTLTVSSHATNQ